MPRSYYWQ